MEFPQGFAPKVQKR